MTRTTTRHLVALGVGALLATALTTTPATADRPGPTATHIQIDRIEPVGVDLPDTTGAAGLFYVEQKEPFEVEVSFYGDNPATTLPLSENRDLDLLLEVTSGPEAGKTHSVEVPAGDEGATFGLIVDDELQLDQPASGVQVEVSVVQKHIDVESATGSFDVLLESNPISSGRNAIGGEGGTADECIATPDEQVCADLLPPATGGFTGGLFSRGVCSDTDPTCDETYIQALVALTGASATSPATLIMKCDKTLCGGGAIKDTPLWVTLAPASEDPFLNGDVLAPACPSKGTVGSYDDSQQVSEDNAPFCVDYVQSTRDNAGDTHLYLLFTVDAKVRFP